MRYRFGRILLDSDARLLTRDGVPLDVGRRAFDCLQFLIENRERAVSRDRLIAHLWRHSNVSDNQLAQVIFSVRRVAGDGGEQQCVIRTVPGYGYHFVAQIVAEELSGQDQTQERAEDEKVHSVALDPAIDCAPSGITFSEQEPTGDTKLEVSDTHIASSAQPSPSADIYPRLVDPEIPLLWATTGNARKLAAIKPWKLIAYIVAIFAIAIFAFYTLSFREAGPEYLGEVAAYPSDGDHLALRRRETAGSDRQLGDVSA